MATNDFPFLNCTAELCVLIYKRLPCTTKYTPARRVEYGTSAIIFVLSYIERAMVVASRLIRQEAESVIDSETQEYGPVQLFSDCEYSHLVLEILAIVRNARDRPFPQNTGLAEEEREDLETKFVRKKLVEEAGIVAIMTRM